MSLLLNLDEITKAWLKPCGPHDYGLPMDCNCPDATRDPRPVISQLVAEIEELRQGTQRLIGFRNLLVAETRELGLRLRRVRELAASGDDAVSRADLRAVLGEPHPIEGRPDVVLAAEDGAR